MYPLEWDMAAYMKKKKSHSTWKAFILMHINQVQGKMSDSKHTSSPDSFYPP